MQSSVNQIIHINHLNIPIIILDTDCVVRDINILAAQLHGLDQQAMLGKHYQIFCQSNELASIFTSKAIENPAPETTIKAVLPYKQGEVTQYIEWMVTSLHIKTDQYSGFLLQGKDVTQAQDQQYLSDDIADRKRAEKLATEQTTATLKSVIKKFTGDASLGLDDVQSYVKELDNYFQNIISELPGFIYWKDRHGVYLGCNKNVLNFFSAQNVSEIVGKTDYEIARKLGLKKDIPEKITRDDKHVMDTGEPLVNQEETPFTTADGNEMFQLSNRMPLKNSEGKVIGILGNTFDISDRKRAEKLAQEKLATEQTIATLRSMIKKFTGDSSLDLDDVQSYVKELDNYFQNIISELPGFIYWKDRHGAYLGCNKNILDLFSAQDVSEVVGKTDYEIARKLGIKKDTPEKVTCYDKYVMDTGEPLLNQEEPPFTTADGDEFFGLTNRMPLKNSEGQVIGVLGNTFDISDRKRAEKLAQEKLVAERTTAALRTIAGSIAHELKNPLAGIGNKLGLIQLIAKELTSFYQEAIAAEIVEAPQGKTPPEKIKECADAAYKRVEYANDYISIQLANMSLDNIDTSKFTCCSINEVMQEALDAYSFDNDAQAVLVHWQGGTDFSFVGSQRLTVHIIWNLLSNALHYIKSEKKGEVTIWLES